MTNYNFRPLAYRIGNGINALLFVLALALAAWHQTWLAALVIGLPALLVPVVLHKLLHDHVLSRSAYGVSFMLFSALHIHQGMGMTEIHFGIFVLLAILIAFRDYIVILVAAGVIAVHHLLFMYLQSNGAGVYLVPQTDATLTIVAVHAAYVIVEAAVLVLICRNSFKEAKVSQAFYDVTKAMVRSDGTVALDQRCVDTGARVTEQFNAALDSIQRVVVEIEQATAQMKDDSAQLLDDGEALSNGMQQQLQQVERIASATEQMSASIEETSEMAQHANEASQAASESASQGKHAVAQSNQLVTDLANELVQAKTTVNAMAGSVEDIKNVLDVIDKVAEQTNLLALNAAIEAARAGEHGRGFAVVADEVRKLASQTRGSTEQIQDNIAQLVHGSTESVSKVEQCLALAQQSLDSVTDSDTLLGQINHHAERVQQAIHTIATALEEQANTSADVANSAQALNNIEQQQSQKSAEVVRRARSIGTVSQNLDTQAAKFVV